MATLAQKWQEEGRVLGRAEGLEKGMEEGLEKGIEKGIEEGIEAQRETLLRLLDWRFPLAEAQKAAYRQQMEQVSDLSLLAQLINQLLAAQNLAEFQSSLLASLSTRKSG